MIRTVIVDDEPIARAGIRERLASEADIEIIGEAGDVSAGLQLIEETRPDLVFLDVQMPGGDGFDLLAAITETPLPAIIFVTAHDEHALQAFEVHAVDYLLKPVSESRFREALDRVRRGIVREGKTAEESNRRYDALLDSIAALGRSSTGPGGRSIERFGVRDGERYLFIRVERVDWIEAAGNYAEIHVGEKEYLVRMTLLEIESRLDAARFSRIHRSTIVNIDRIREIVPEPHGDAEVVMESGAVLRMSRNYRNRLIPPR
ncbi:MAG: LytR/AlgR family response regulator transcription factor [bacterium]